MSMGQLTSFFMWCSIINVAMLLWAFLFLWLARDWVYRMQSRFFPMPKEQWTVTIYTMLGVYKLLVFGLFVIPWVALLIVA